MLVEGTKLGKIWNYIKSRFFVILPFIQSHYANKRIEKSLKITETKEIEESLDSLREEYNRSFIGKDKLEDKAKTNIVAITISITLIMGASDIVSGLIINPLWFWMPYVAVLLSVGAVIYMIVAGTSAFKLLMDKNVVYYVSSKSENKQEYFESKEGNNKYNLIRNNLLYTSFRCIENALLCLFIIFTLVLINQFEYSSDVSGANAASNTNVEIYFSNSVTQISHFSELRFPAETIVREYYFSNKLKTGEYIGLIDTKNKFFVKILRQSDNILCVVSIEPYISN